MQSHYHLQKEAEILSDLQNGTVPAGALVQSCCWKEICRVRGLNIGRVRPETWVELCGQRGYLMGRQNPRGF